MTHRPVKAMTHITANEDGSLELLLHAGAAGDRVHYAMVVNGNRCEGVVRDPSYEYRNGMDGNERSRARRHEVPQFTYITETLPDNVTVPFVRVGDCPVPITELQGEPCRPAYFILKLPDTGLPVGDTVIQVSINGRRRDYHVHRPEFAVHNCGLRDLGPTYRKLVGQPDGMFDLQTDNGREVKADVHVITKGVPRDAAYLVYMANDKYAITLDFSWTDSGLIVITLQQGLPAGRYKCVVAWSADNEHWTELVQGHVVVEEREQDDMPVEIEPGLAYTERVDLRPYNVPHLLGSTTLFRAIGYDADGQGTDLGCSVDGDYLVVEFPAQQADAQSVVEWTCYFSTIEGVWVAMAGGDVTVKDGTNAYKSIRRERSFLYATVFDSLDREYADSYYSSRYAQAAAGACTCVRSGGFFGRNFDWTYDNTAVFVVHVPKADGRHASVGVTGFVSGLTEDFVNSGAYSPMYKLVPFSVVDGINDAGLTVGTNVVPAGDKGDNSTVEPTGMVEEEACMFMLPRLLLDRFSDAESAVEWVIAHVRLHNIQALAAMGYEQHFLVADATSTWCIEFVDGRARAIDLTEGSNELLAGRTYMTNFHLYGTHPRDEGDPMVTPLIHQGSPDLVPSVVNGLTPMSSGVERYNLVADRHAGADSLKGMRELMEDLSYTRAYQSSPNPAYPRWDTEFVGGDIDADTVSSGFDNIQAIAAGTYTDRSRDTSLTWQTVHTSVYDMAARRLHLNVQEKYYETFTYDI